MINSFEIGFDDTLGNSLKKYFEDRTIKHYCKRCKRNKARARGSRSHGFF